MVSRHIAEMVDRPRRSDLVAQFPEDTPGAIDESAGAGFVAAGAHGRSKVAESSRNFGLVGLGHHGRAPPDDCSQVCTFGVQGFSVASIHSTLRLRAANLRCGVAIGAPALSSSAQGSG